MTTALLALPSSAALADHVPDGVRPIGEKPPEPPKLASGRAPEAPTAAFTQLCAFTLQLPMGWLLVATWPAAEVAPPEAPGGIVAPGDKPPKGPR
jgi:hypothetical protein